MAKKKKPPLRTVAARLLQSMRKKRAGGRPKIYRRCKYCRDPFSAREMRAHSAVCPKRP